MKWEEIQLSQLIEKPISGEWGEGEGRIPVIRNTNFTNEGKLNLSEVVCRNIPQEKVQKKKLIPGDIIIEKSGGSPTQPVGRVVFFEEEGTYLYSNFTSAIRPIRDRVFPKYLLYILVTVHKFGIVSKFQNKTTGIINLKLKRYVDELTIPLPPLPEQRRIAAILDAADALRRHDKALIEQYDALIQSVFHEMFGDLDGELSSISSISTINPPKKKISNLSKSLEVSFISMSKVSETGEIILNENKSIGEVWSGFTFFEENDVLFAKITPCMENGKGGIARGLENGIGFGSTEFHILRPNDLSTPDYLYYLTKLEKFRKQAEQNMTGSAGQKRVPKSFFDKYMVVVPSIPLQQQFANRVSAIKAQKAHAQESLAQSEALFGSLMQKAFKGEL